MLAQGFGHTREVSMVPKHNLLLDCVVELGGRAVPTIHDLEGIERLLATLLLGQEMVAPRLVTQINHRFQSRGITDPADHGWGFLGFSLKMTWDP